MTVVLALLLGLVVGAVLGVCAGLYWASKVAAESVKRVNGDLVDEVKRLRASLEPQRTQP